MKLSEIYRDYLDTIESFSAADWKRITREAERHTSDENDEFYLEDDALQSFTDYHEFKNGYEANRVRIQVVVFHMTKQRYDENKYPTYSGEGEVA